VTVTVACAMTWVGAGLVTAMMLLFILVLALGGDSFVDQVQSAGANSDVDLSSDQVMAVGWGVAAVLLFWSLAAIVLAVLAFRRSNPSRIALVVSAAMTALVSLLAIMSIVSLLPLILAVAVLILLFTGGANQWYSRHPTGSSAGPVDPRTGPAPRERPKPW